MACHAAMKCGSSPCFYRIVLVSLIFPDSPVGSPRNNTTSGRRPGHAQNPSAIAAPRPASNRPFAAGLRHGASERLERRSVLVCDGFGEREREPRLGLAPPPCEFRRSRWVICRAVRIFEESSHHARRGLRLAPVGSPLCSDHERVGRRSDPSACPDTCAARAPLASSAPNSATLRSAVVLQVHEPQVDAWHGA